MMQIVSCPGRHSFDFWKLGIVICCLRHCTYSLAMAIGNQLITSGNFPSAWRRQIAVQGCFKIILSYVAFTSSYTALMLFPFSFTFSPSHSRALRLVVGESRVVAAGPTILFYTFFHFHFSVSVECIPPPLPTLHAPLHIHSSFPRTTNDELHSVRFSITFWIFELQFLLWNPVLLYIYLVGSKDPRM